MVADGKLDFANPTVISVQLVQLFNMITGVVLGAIYKYANGKLDFANPTVSLVQFSSVHSVQVFNVITGVVLSSIYVCMPTLTGSCYFCVHSLILYKLLPT